MNVCTRWRVDLLELDWERRYVLYIHSDSVNRDENHEMDNYGEKWLKCKKK